MAYDEVSIEMVRTMLIVMLKISAPILVAGVLIGLVISILQAVTSIQDQTIAFVPKIVAMVIVAAILMPWIVQRLVEYSIDLMTLH